MENGIDPRTLATQADIVRPLNPTPPMKIVCATSVALAAEAFSPLGTLVLADETTLTPHTVSDADAVITRSKTRLNRRLLQGSRVRFAGTCTAGTDHVNPAELADLDIAFASAPGCNANAVSEYVVAALLEIHRRTGFDPRGQTLGIVGHGQVGTRVEAKALALGMRVLKNDPPKQDAGSSETFTPLEDLLAQSDIVSLHVPLVEQGPYPTRHLLNADRIQRMKPGAILLNACRGDALDGTAAARARRRRSLSALVLDVWDPEPDFPADLLHAADLGTAHIAGHSVEGKVNGTRQVREALVAHFGLDVPAWDPTPLLPPPAQPDVVLPPGAHDLERLRRAVAASYDIRRDDALLRQPADSPGTHFTSLRRNYRDRREFNATRACGLRPDEIETFRALGFAVPAQ